MFIRYAAIVLLVFVCALVVAFTVQYSSQTFSENTIVIGGKSLVVERARTPNEWAHGLMDRESLPKNNGMLFIFPETGVRTFWNQRTLISLDIIWIRDDRVIGVSQLPRVQDQGIVEVSSPKPVNFVLEVNAGWAKENNIQVGVSFQK